jgi:cytoskeletal protein CcmA (bactofilin family)
LKTKEANIIQDAVTIISPGVTLEGKLKSDGNIRIDGKIKGDVKANGNVTVGTKGEIEGEVNAQTIILGGKIIGSVNAGEKVVLESAAKLNGDLITKILVVEEGASFNGNCKTQNEGQLNLTMPSSKIAQQ